MELTQNLGGDDTFLYALSHDLREPARMVGQLLKLVKTKLDKQLDQDTSDYLMYAIDASDRMDSMIKALSELNKVKRYEEEDSSFSAKELVEKVKYKLRDELKFREAFITEHLDSEITSKKNLLEKIITELIYNSLQHAKSDAPLQLELRVFSQENSINIEVIDNGNDIPEFWLQKAFEPFKKANKKSRNDGIGLTKLKILTEKFEGNIRMIRSEDHKTSVLCCLPKTTAN